MKTTFILLYVCVLALPLISFAPQQVYTLSQQEKDAALARHNELRADVGNAALVWDDSLAAFAQEWAVHLAQQDGALQHREPNMYGENLAAYYPMRTNIGVVATNSWYKEKKLYKGGVLTPKNWYASGHYTQIVWHSTTKMGMGVAVSATGKVYVVCNYFPHGNVLGERAYNKR